MKQALVAASDDNTITGIPALIIILVILGAIVGVGVLIGRLSKGPRK